MTKQSIINCYINNGDNMRHFYIFNISNEFINLTKKNPFQLYKTFEELYQMPKNEIIYGVNIYDNMTKPINKNNINDELFNTYYLNYFYSKFKNIHLYNDYFKNENTKLIIKNSYMLLETSVINPIFLKFLNKYSSLFACDFENKDYFWLESIA